MVVHQATNTTIFRSERGLPNGFEDSKSPAGRWLVEKHEEEDVDGRSTLDRWPRCMPPRGIPTVEQERRATKQRKGMRKRHLGRNDEVSNVLEAYSEVRGSAQLYD